MKRIVADINFEEGERLEMTVRRSVLGYVVIWGGVIFSLVFLTIITVLIPSAAKNIGDQLLFSFDPASISYLYLILGILCLVVFLTGVVASFVYKNNYLYVTNKRLIHLCTDSLFSSSTNVIDLESIEDVSFHQKGIMQHIFSIGTIRLSTMGDETTYTFKYVDTPTDELAKITHLVHTEKQKDNKNR